MAGDEEFEGPFGDDIEDILRGSSYGETGPESLEHLLDSEPENLQPRQLNEKEVTVMGVYEHQEQGLPPAAFVLLRDTLGRQVVIWIGRFEAYAISAALEGALYDRPMTHDLLKNMADRLGAKIERITIDDLWQDTYYAKISASAANGDVVEIDSRPSDAIALALRAKAPVFMAESVLSQASLNEDL